jgi:PKD repeat protein
MLRAFFLTATIFLLAYTMQAQVDLKKDLVAFYPFNGNFEDESGNGNHPAKVKAELTTDRNGKQKSACLFNGKNSFIRIANNSTINFRGPFSMSAWVMINGFYEGLCHGNRIVMKGPYDYLDGNYMLTFDDNYSSKGGNCYTAKPDKARQSFYAAGASPAGANYIKPGTWYLLTYTYDGNKANLYVNCVLSASGTLRNYQFSNRYDLFLGKMDNDQYPYWFNGVLDEFRMYKRALSVEEIRVLCNEKIKDASPEDFCRGVNKPNARFEYNISNCTQVSFKPEKSTAIKTVRWSFGDGTSSKEMSPSHIYKKPGTYRVRLIISNKYGCSDTLVRELKLSGFQADFVYEEKGDPGVLQFKAKNNRASYSWDFGNGATARNESAVTTSYIQSGVYKVTIFAENSVGCYDTLSRDISISLPEPEQQKTKEVVTTIIESSKEIEPRTKKMESRNKDVQEVLTIGKDSVLVQLYDNGIIDGDTITLVYNGKVILSGQRLSGKATSFYLQVAPGTNNELTMYAENLGSIPPNTALMIVHDGEIIHKVNLSSTAKTNGVVTFSRKN